ncbi:MAG: FG-GAP repeat protein, partial [Candidatus Omnitrophica bacterium]|nr:FG-GAP repeat protein [Candidatus Omnitrophota bacterium]
GISVSGILDVNGDGFGDVVVGAPFENPGASPNSAGRAYIFDGATGALLHTLISPDEESSGLFGYSVAGIPDVNGDGLGDLVVGANGEDPDTSPDGAGRAHIFDGATGAFLRTLTSPNEESSGQFGDSVSGVPDVNGDGRGDVVIGAFQESPGASPIAAGRAYIFDGATGVLLHTLASPNEESGSYFGTSVAGVLDLNGDGRGDVIVGADGENPGASPLNAGRAYIFDGASGGLLQTLAAPNERERDYFGHSVSGIADFNGDGLGDVVVGNKFDPPGEVSPPYPEERVHIFDGSSGTLIRTLTSPNAELYGRFGISVSGAPDANGDGLGDVVVGAELEDPGTSPGDAGRAYIFHSSNDFDTDGDGVAGVVEDAGPNAGDSNEDGIPDRNQANVASLPNAEDGRYVTVIVPGPSALTGVKAMSVDSFTPAPPEGIDIPLGLFEFNITGVSPGGSTTAELILPDTFYPSTYFKYGQTQVNPNSHWYEFLYDGSTGADIAGNRVTLHFNDGGRGDNDLTADGVIKDPGGPAVVISSGVENWSLYEE